MKGTALEATSIYKEYTSDNNACIVIFNNNGFIDYVNDAFCSLCEYSREELIGKDNKIIKTYNQSESYLNLIDSALKSGSIWHDKIDYQTKKNITYKIDRTIIPFLDTENQIEMYVNIYIDITKQKDFDIDAQESYAVDKHSIVAKTDNLGVITYVNDNFCNLSGYKKEELIGQKHNLLNSGNKPKSYWKNMYQTISKGSIWQDEVKNKNKNGSYYWVDTTIVPQLDKEGKPIGYISLRTDITKQKELSNTLIKHKFAVDQHAIIATTDVQGKITYANDKFCEISGYSVEELLGNKHNILNSGNQSISYWTSMYKTLNNGNIWKDQVKNISKNGSYYWVDTTIIPFMNDDGKPNSYFSIRTDITYQKRIEEILSNQRFAMDQHSIIAITDIKGKITYANDKFCDISGYLEDELLGQNHRILNSKDKPSLYWKEMYSSLKEKGIWQDEVKNKAKDGSFYWVDTTIVPLLNSMGKADCYISIRTDITKYKKVQEELKNHQNNLEKLVQERTQELDIANKKLRRLTELDTLTGLYNRRKLTTDFNRELRRVNRLDKKMALYFLDLDKFKNVNDKYGHEIGDKLLKLIAEQTINKLRENEYLYRIGGDEFCILVPEFTEKKELDALATRLLEMISNIKTIGNHKIDIGCSIGISIFPDNGQTLSDLISEADKAMYMIKKKGKNNYHFLS